MNEIEEARRLIAEERERQTGFLDIGNLGLTELPTELFDLTQLKSLVVGDSYFRPDTGWHTSMNKHLPNAIRSLPTAIADLRHLKDLSLSGNPVESLDLLEGLGTLTSLDCSGTRVTDLWPLRSLLALELLSCSRTSVADLGPLQELRGLRWLECRATSVSDLGVLRRLSALAGC